MNKDSKKNAVTKSWGCDFGFVDIDECIDHLALVKANERGDTPSELQVFSCG